MDGRSGPRGPQESGWREVRLQRQRHVRQERAKGSWVGTQESWVGAASRMACLCGWWSGCAGQSTAEHGGAAGAGARTAGRRGSPVNPAGTDRDRDTCHTHGEERQGGRLVGSKYPVPHVPHVPYVPRPAPRLARARSRARPRTRPRPPAPARPHARTCTAMPASSIGRARARLVVNCKSSTPGAFRSGASEGSPGPCTCTCSIASGAETS